MRYANEIIVEELKNDREFLKLHITSTITSFFNREQGVACLMLRDIVNATIGFPALAEKLGRSDKGKGLMQMLTEKSNPTTDNLFAIIHEILIHEGLAFTGAEIADQAA
jgi:DNA-binding phage protein